MVKPFVIILILCYISTTISYNFRDRIVNLADDEKSADMVDSSPASSSIDHCVPVRAVKGLGCILSKRYPLFKGFFRPICEHHQLCYACGFAHNVTARKCNKLALVNMYELCFQNSFSSLVSFLHCLKQRISAIILLRQHIYRSASGSTEMLFECQQQCVLDYLQEK